MEQEAPFHLLPMSERKRRYEVEIEDTLVCAIAPEDEIQIQSTGKARSDQALNLVHKWTRA